YFIFSIGHPYSIRGTFLHGGGCPLSTITHGTPRARMGKLMPRVSIVTISFNQAPFLERAIRSVLEQDHPDVEYIVVDPGSTDGSREIIEKYRSRIAKVILEPDRGPANGLNKGFAAATGEILGY